MGLIHAVIAAGSWELPTGKRAVGGAAIVEEKTNTHHDTVGAAAQMVNNLYAVCKPPLIDDRYETAFTDTGIGDSVKTRYKVPVWHVGTGLGNETGVVFSALVKVTANTGGVKVSTPNSSGEKTFTNTAYAWVEFTTRIRLDDVPDLDDDPEITIGLRMASGVGTASLLAIKVEWDVSETNLPDAYPDPYENTFLPCPTDDQGGDEIDLVDETAAISVEMISRILADLDVLFRTRTPGVICTSWKEAGAQVLSPAGDERWIARAYQYQHVHRIRVWIYATWAAGTVAAGVTRPVSGGSFVTDTSAGREWRKVDFEVVAHRLSDAIKEVFTVTASAGTMECCCAWFHPVEVDL